MIVQGKIKLLDITDGALWYHADYVKPSWAKHKKITTEIGDHIFYTIKRRGNRMNIFYLNEDPKICTRTL